MDIDEFLDREFSQVAMTPPAIERHAEPQEFKAAESIQQVPVSFEHIKDDLSKGNLDTAEKSYVQLWNILLQENLKWNKELYEQLLIISRQFSTTLTSSYNDSKKKANRIYELIHRARAALKEEKRETAFKLYSEISDISNSVPSVFFEEKKVIHEQIMELYKELKNSTDNELTKRVYGMIHEINQLIDKINFSIKSNDIINAIANYKKCVETYNQIPEGFMIHKTSAAAILLEIYKSLSIYTEMSKLQNQLGYQVSPTQGYSQTAQPAHAQPKPMKSAEIEGVPKPEPKHAEQKAASSKII